MNTERLCATCGQPLGHCAQNTLYPNDKDSGWHSIHVCVNPDCERFLEAIPPIKGLGMKNTAQCKREKLQP